MRKKLAMKICALAMTAAMVGTMAGCGNGDTASGSANESGSAAEGSSDAGAGTEESGGADQGSEESSADGGEGAEGGEAASTFDGGGATIRINGGMWDDLRDDNKNEDGSYAQSYTIAWDMAAQLEAKYNIKLEYVKLQNDDGYDTATAIQNGILSGECFADIFTAGDDVTLSLRNYLVDITPFKDSLEMGSIYLEPATWAGKCYGFTYDNMGSVYVLAYSRDYLQSIGMDVTPTQKFLEGKWSYEDCTAYLTELKAKLPDGVYPFGIHSTHWASMAPAANGAVSVDSDGGIHIADENYTVTLEYYRSLVDAGLAAPITDVKKNDDGSLSANQTYGMDNMCASSGPKNAEGDNVVMTMVEAWQMEGLETSLAGSWGIVPFPWGPDVTVSGDYTTLSENYSVAQSIWTNMLVPKAEYRAAGAKDIPDEVLFQIARDWCDMKNVAGGQVRKAAFDAEQSGTPYVNLGYDPGQIGAFSTEEDAALYDWLHSRVTVDWGHAMQTLEYVNVNRNAAFVIAAGDDARSSGESFKQAGEEKLAEAFGSN